MEAPAGGRHDGPPYQVFHDHHLDEDALDGDDVDDDALDGDDVDDDAQVGGHLRPACSRDCEHLCQVPAILLLLPQEVPRRRDAQRLLRRLVHLHLRRPPQPPVLHLWTQGDFSFTLIFLSY